MANMQGCGAAKYLPVSAYYDHDSYMYPLGYNYGSGGYGMMYKPYHSYVGSAVNPAPAASSHHAGSKAWLYIIIGLVVLLLILKLVTIMGGTHSVRLEDLVPLP